MFFWFIATACLAVGLVFRDRWFDYRLLIVGSFVPILDSFFGPARIMHAIITSMLLMGVIMLMTVGRKPLRKTLLGLPIGMFFHLFFDAAWSNTEIFWWPFTGWSFEKKDLPVVDRGWWGLILEVVGIALFAWLVRRNELATKDGCKRFLRYGTLVTVPGRFA